MSEVRFIEFQSITSKCSSNGIQTCAHFSSTEQCQEPIQLHSPAERELLQDLCDKLHATDVLDKANRSDLLQQIASLTLCYAHGEAEDIDAAMVQWETEIQSRVSTTQPQTPIAASTRDKQSLRFHSYYTPRSRKKPDSPEALDVMVRQLLSGNIGVKQKECLYVFSDNHTSDAYKVGCGADLSRAMEGWEKCYPKHKLHCFTECPNAYLFERVVHAELALYRRRHKCTMCPREHEEWFEAPLPVILDSVRAWSSYASMLYRRGLAIDGYHQILPLAGFSNRQDRWRRWALKETMRWMDGTPGHTDSSQEQPPPERIDLTNSGNISGSETASTASTASSPASSCDTPGTTPATTPGSFGMEEYGLSPTPGVRYDTRKPEVPDEDNDDIEGKSESVVRALFPRAKPGSPSSPGPTIPAEDVLPSKIETSNLPKSSVDPVSEPPSTSMPSSTRVDEKVRDLLEKNTEHPYNPGTIYLTPPHPQKGSSKIYYRQDKPRSKRERYTNLPPDLEIRCTDAAVIQGLVLAEFDGWTHKDTCGRDGCKTGHFNWINRPGDVISASVQAWATLLERGYDRALIPPMGFSRDADRWTKWAQETATKGKQRKTDVSSDVNGACTDPPKKGEHGGAMRMIRRVSTFMKMTGKSKGPPKKH
ncbi:GIY-YIG nuclease family protein [Aspergillus puulaauensis]|uniref:Bacteriophage T5 Orf172 DNA-binding domain-containing protein n=1 Tax=Aspergillus puulaauensis TaxID=1220207 RepID=A0A7R8API7_9EURO|nr:uncharacterized protein APUU_41322S [Aspergillus puulaauensis]BCS24878.1 hypothetical protein APUU_41322S [Aspergillus puulaauensis]